jgi:hypothetical protein
LGRAEPGETKRSGLRVSAVGDELH